jgi:hypothetical protein
MYLTSSSMKIIVINTKNNTRIKVHPCKKNRNKPIPKSKKIDHQRKEKEQPE